MKAASELLFLWQSREVPFNSLKCFSASMKFHDSWTIAKNFREASGKGISPIEMPWLVRARVFARNAAHSAGLCTRSSFFCSNRFRIATERFLARSRVEGAADWLCGEAMAFYSVETEFAILGSYGRPILAISACTRFFLSSVAIRVMPSTRPYQFCTNCVFDFEATLAKCSCVSK